MNPRRHAVGSALVLFPLRLPSHTRTMSSTHRAGAASVTLLVYSRASGSPLVFCCGSPMFAGSLLPQENHHGVLDLSSLLARASELSDSVVFFNWPHVRGKPKGRHSNKTTARIIAGKTEHTLYPRARLCLCACVCVLVCLFAYVRIEFRRHTHVCA